MLTLDIIENEIKHVIAHGNDRNDIALLADLYICRSMMRPGEGQKIAVKSESEFASCVNGRCVSDVVPQIEELLDAVKTLHPKLYECFIDRIR